MTKLNPYLTFLGDATQAMQFYHSVFGGKLKLNTFKDSNSSPNPALDDQIMHSELIPENGMTIMASDDPEQKEKSNTSISLSGEEEHELEVYWDRLCDGATITAPFEKAPWGDKFGMLTDKFGTRWLINVNSIKEHKD